MRLGLKRDLIYALLLLTITLVVYLPRAAMAPQHSDGAEYAAAAVTGSIVHPPGYPVYMGLARAVVSIFPRNPYNALALTSGIFQSLAALLLFFIGVKLTARRFVSVSVALGWALFGPTMYTATDVEVFAFHHFLIGLTVLTALGLGGDKSNQKANSDLLAPILFGLSAGIACAHHQTIILWFPFLLWLYVEHLLGLPTHAQRCKSFIGAFFSFALGFSSYLTLLFVHADSVTLAFTPPKTFGELYHYIMRSNYGSLSLTAPSEGELKSYLGHFSEIVLRQYPLIVFSLPVLIGVVIKNRAAKFVALSFSLILHGIFVYLLILPINSTFISDWIARFYPLVLYFLCFTFLFLLRSFSLTKAANLFIILAISIPLLVNLKRRLLVADARSDFVTGYEVATTLKELPPNSVYIASSDRISISTVYAVKARGERPDVTVIILGLLDNPTYQKELVAENRLFKELSAGEFNLKELVDLIYDNNGYVFSNFGTELPSGYKALPLGVSWQWVKSDELPPRNEVTKRILAYCSTWPDSLPYVPRERISSRQVLGSIFLWPILKHVPLVENEMVRERLQVAARSFTAGDLKKAREACNRGYTDLTGEETSQLAPYN